MHFKSLKIQRILVLLFLFTFIFSILFSLKSIAYSEDYEWSNKAIQIPNESTPIKETNTQNSPSLSLECESCILIDQDSGQTLFEKNCHEQLRPASVTKIMTILLIMEALDSNKIQLTDTVPCSENASSMGGSQIWLTTTENLTVEDMLKSICIVSANDCAVAMAEFLSGSTTDFVNLMNKRAKELGMNDTCFKNCHGIDEEGHITSSYDIAIMSRELLKNHPSITKYTTIWMDSIRSGKSELVNTNKLVRNYKGCTGLKTGSTSLALYNLSASATRNNINLIAVVMKAPTTALRFSNAKMLLDYGFNNFKHEQLATQNDIVKEISISKGIEPKLNAICSESKSILLNKNDNNSISQKIEIPDTLDAPIQKGQNVGKIIYYQNDQEISTVNIIAEKDIPKIKFRTIASYIFKKWISLL